MSTHLLLMKSIAQRQGRNNIKACMPSSNTREHAACELPVEQILCLSSIRHRLLTTRSSHRQVLSSVPTLHRL